MIDGKASWSFSCSFLFAYHLPGPYAIHLSMYHLYFNLKNWSKFVSHQICFTDNLRNKSSVATDSDIGIGTE